MRFSAFILLALALSFNTVMAEHENDHRYNIRGYVLDSQQRPVKGLDVRVFDGHELLKNGKTDSSGFYSLQLHIHDPDLGKKLRLVAGSNQAELTVTFDPGDVDTVRVHEANFIAGKFTEESLGRFRLPSWVYPLAGLVLIGFILVALERRRKRKIRLKQHGSVEKSSRSKSPGRKKKSKKR